MDNSSKIPICLGKVAAGELIYVDTQTRRATTLNWDPNSRAVSRLSLKVHTCDFRTVTPLRSRLGCKLSTISSILWRTHLHFISLMQPISASRHWLRKESTSLSLEPEKVVEPDGICILTAKQPKTSDNFTQILLKQRGRIKLEDQQPWN